MFVAAWFTVIRLDSTQLFSVSAWLMTLVCLSHRLPLCSGSRARLAAGGMPGWLQLLSGFTGKWWQAAEVL